MKRQLMMEGGIASKQPGILIPKGYLNYEYIFPFWELIIYFYCIWNHFRTEQTATLKVDGGHIITGASPGKLRQLNGNGHLFIGNKNSRFEIDYR